VLFSSPQRRIENAWLRSPPHERQTSPRAGLLFCRHPSSSFLHTGRNNSIFPPSRDAKENPLTSLLLFPPTKCFFFFFVGFFLGTRLFSCWSPSLVPRVAAVVGDLALLAVGLAFCGQRSFSPPFALSWLFFPFSLWISGLSLLLFVWLKAESGFLSTTLKLWFPLSCCSRAFYPSPEEEESIRCLVDGDAFFFLVEVLLLALHSVDYRRDRLALFCKT